MASAPTAPLGSIRPSQNRRAGWRCMPDGRLLVSHAMIGAVSIYDTTEPAAETRQAHHTGGLAEPGRDRLAGPAARARPHRRQPGRQAGVAAARAVEFRPSVPVPVDGISRDLGDRARRPATSMRRSPAASSSSSRSTSSRTATRPASSPIPPTSPSTPMAARPTSPWPAARILPSSICRARCRSIRKARRRRPRTAPRRWKSSATCRARTRAGWSSPATTSTSRTPWASISSKLTTGGDGSLRPGQGGRRQVREAGLPAIR